MYIDSFKDLAQEENLSTNIDVTEITKLPDVVIVKSNIDEEQIKTELLQVVENAVNNLIEMRQYEGNRISGDILDKISQIEEKNYSEPFMSNRMIQSIYAYGIAFAGKNCAVSVKKLK